MIVIEEKTHSGMQLTPDYPTIKMAFVMPDLIEIHFFQEVDYKDNYISCNVIEKIPSPPNGILYCFYKGLEVYEV